MESDRNRGSFWEGRAESMTFGLNSMRRRWTSEDKGKGNQAERRAAAEVVKWDRICRVEGQKAAPCSRGSYTKGEGGDESPWGVSGGRRKGDSGV